MALLDNFQVLQWILNSLTSSDSILSAHFKPLTSSWTKCLIFCSTSSQIVTFQLNWKLSKSLVTHIYAWDTAATNCRYYSSQFRFRFSSKSNSHCQSSPSSCFPDFSGCFQCNSSGTYCSHGGTVYFANSSGFLFLSTNVFSGSPALYSWWKEIGSAMSGIGSFCRLLAGIFKLFSSCSFLAGFGLRLGVGWRIGLICGSLIAWGCDLN